MVQKALISGDVILEKQADTNQELEIIPGGIESLPITDLRWNETSVVDAKLETDFFIDDNGIKHIQNLDPTGTALTPSTETLTLNRRGGPDDEIKRTAGSFVTDGFTTGMWITINGSTSNDAILLVKTVSTLQITIDETVSRIVVDEGPKTGITLYGGWQFLGGIAFSNIVKKDADGVWVVQTDSQLQVSDAEREKTRTNSAATAATDSSLPDDVWKRDVGEFEFAIGRILEADNTSGVTATSLRRDMNVFGVRIYNQDKATQVTGVSLTFSNANPDTITRTTGDFTTDGFKVGMTLTVTGGDNAGGYTIAAVTSTVLTLVLGATLTAEGPTTVPTLDAMSSVKGYKNLKASAASKYKILMQTAVVHKWMDVTRVIERGRKTEINNATKWAASITYSIDDVVWVKDKRQFYKASIGHTSTSSFDDDISSWGLIDANTLVFPIYPQVQVDS